MKLFGNGPSWCCLLSETPLFVELSGNAVVTTTTGIALNDDVLFNRNGRLSAVISARESSKFSFYTTIEKQKRRIETRVIKCNYVYSKVEHYNKLHITIIPYDI